MTSGYQVVLDACVLVNAALRDTLLRLAEPPHLYLPRWSKDIILETVRTLETKLGVTPAQTAHLVHEMELYFADAWIEDYDPLIPAMTNHPKDRHVLAAWTSTDRGACSEACCGEWRLSRCQRGSQIAWKINTAKGKETELGLTYRLRERDIRSPK